MGKVSAKRVGTPAPAKDVLDGYMDSLASNAKRQFIGATINMSWRLAITVVVPIVAGVKLDERFSTSPSYTLLGLMIAAVAGCAAVWSSVKQVNQEQAKQSKNNLKETK